MPRKLASKLAKFGDSLKDAAESMKEKIEEKVDVPIVIDVKGIKHAGNECYASARETSGLCKITIQKAREMVAFGHELETTLNDVCFQSSMQNRRRSMNASKFEVIRDLVEGDKIQSATQLAKDLSSLSLQCVEKSKKMMDSMEKGIDALPDVVEPFVEKKLLRAAKKGSKKGDPELPDVGASVRELQSLVSDVETVNLFTVVKSGGAAFVGLRKNGEISKDMFLSIQKFADDVESVTGSFRDFKPPNTVGNSIQLMGKLRKIAKDAWRCLRLSGLMKAFAEQVGLLIKWIIKLFQMASLKLGAIWGALANAKTVLTGCLVYVNESIRLCDDSKQKTLLLRDTSRTIHHHLQNIMKYKKSGPVKALDSFRELADGEEILLCIQLCTQVDDMFSDCAKQVVLTIEKVDDAIRSMPSVLKQDVPESLPIANNNYESDDEIEFDDDDEVERQNKAFRDGCTNGVQRKTQLHQQRTRGTFNIEDDVRQLEVMRSGIENASPLTFVRKSAEGFGGISQTVETCGEMIHTSRGFAESCQTSIDSFNNGEWDLEVASGQILELFAVRDAGLAMREFVQGVLELVRANLAVMKAVRSKSKSTLGGASINSQAVSSLVESLTSDGNGEEILKGMKKLGTFLKR